MKSALAGWMGHGRAEKVVVIGLDSAAPDLVFNRFAADLPHLQGLIESGGWGPLESVVPAITVPAWACAMTGRDPGELGIYGFRHRSDHRYQAARLVDSTDLRQDAVWDVLSRQGRPVIVVGVPPAYPARRVQGSFVSCFLTPDVRRPATHPRALGQTIARVAARYAVDVEGYRSDERPRLLEAIREMTEQRFSLFRHLLRTETWVFAMMVEIGLDRLQHAFWSAFDREHPRYLPGGPHESAVRDYYRLLDREVGATLGELDDRTAVFVISDHGAKRLQGGICVNQWLLDEGFLSLRSTPSGPTPLLPELVDWSRTVAWAEGGHCGRVFLNVRGRQPHGIVDPNEQEAVCDRLAAGLGAIEDDRGQALATEVFRPRRIYRECRNVPPDLLVYFGNLDWRAIGAVGSGALHVAENDTGPDDANHDVHGIFIGRVPGIEGRRIRGLRLIDCGPAMLRLLGS
jgi:predicted AlkP superfamily phosphohydrolase/phosphomutase